MADADNYSIPIYVESRYKVNRRRIKHCVAEELAKYRVKGPVEVSVAVVGKRKMKSLNVKYRNKNIVSNVLAFCQQEGDKVPTEDDVLMLGDVVVCYPVLIDDAARERMLVDDAMCELIAHGVRHLLGKNPY